MWVKICGTTSLADALLAVDAGADAVGFVFAESKRKVMPEAVAEITALLPGEIEKVGVFTTGDPYEVEHIVAVCGLTAAQLHTPFDRDMVLALSDESGGKLKILQVVTYDNAAENAVAADRKFAADLRAAAAEPAVWAVLLDTARGSASGGTGVPFNWQRAETIVRDVLTTAQPTRLIVAGGLQPGNVGEAIRRFQPFGVDVVSGVELLPGRKDEAKVQAFVAEARRSPGA